MEVFDVGNIKLQPGYDLHFTIVFLKAILLVGHVYALQ